MYYPELPVMRVYAAPGNREYKVALTKEFLAYLKSNHITLERKIAQGTVYSVFKARTNHMWPEQRSNEVAVLVPMQAANKVVPYDRAQLARYYATYNQLRELSRKDCIVLNQKYKDAWDTLSDSASSGEYEHAADRRRDDASNERHSTPARTTPHYSHIFADSAHDKSVRDHHLHYSDESAELETSAQSWHSDEGAGDQLNDMEHEYIGLNHVIQVLGSGFDGNVMQNLPGLELAQPDLQRYPIFVEELVTHDLHTYYMSLKTNAQRKLVRNNFNTWWRATLEQLNVHTLCFMDIRAHNFGVTIHAATDQTDDQLLDFCILSLHDLTGQVHACENAPYERLHHAWFAATRPPRHEFVDIGM